VWLKQEERGRQKEEGGIWLLRNVLMLGAHDSRLSS
jgi:hypothetical protein